MTPIPPRVRSIIAQVAAKHGVTVEDILGPSVKRRCARPRFEAMYRVRNEVWLRTWASSPKSPANYCRIADWFGRDHSTVMRAIMRHGELIDRQSITPVGDCRNRRNSDADGGNIFA